MNAIVLTFDRLPQGFLGCYGNGWVDTPNFDRLAAQSAVFHQHFAEYPADGFAPAWSSGRYECRRSSRRVADRHGEACPLANDLRNAGVTFRLLLETTPDDRENTLAGFPPDITETVTGIDGLDVPADETPFARLIARAHRDLRLLKTSRREPWLLWIKSRGVPTPWLAPREFAAKFLDISGDEDEAGEDAADDVGEELDGAEAVLEMSPSEFDDLLKSASVLPAGRSARDTMTGIARGLMRKVFGGYVALLDAGLGRLLDQVDQAASTAPMLLIVAASRGVTLREPGVLRDEWEPLGEETVHAPLFVRPAGMTIGSRRQNLVQPVDLFPTLMDWFGVDASRSAGEGCSLLPIIRGEQSEIRDRAFSGNGKGLVGVRTRDYYLVKNRSSDGEAGERHRLFSKPEDIWETDDLAEQLPDMVDQLSGELERFFSEGES